MACPSVSDDEIIKATQEAESDNDLLECSQKLEEGDVWSKTRCERFSAPVDDETLREIAESCLPRNTLKRNKWSLNTFNTWAIARNNRRSETETKKVKGLLFMNKMELFYWLAKFVCEVRKTDGTDYPAKSLVSLVMGIQGFIRMEKKEGLDILKDAEFEMFRQVLDGRMKSITRMGVGTNPRQAEVFSPEQEDKFWELKILGDHNPVVLLRTLVFLNGKNFALRSGNEHRRLRFLNCQISISSEDDIPCLKYTEDVSKTNQGGLRHMRVQKKIATMFPAANPDRCHIRLFKLYCSLRPSTGRDNAFYLTPLHKPTNDVWYSRQACGHNTLQKMVPEMCRQAGLKGHYTNHSLRATAATTLYRAGIDEQLIMSQTGHRSVSGVRCYKRTNEDQKRLVSDILNNDKRQRGENDVLCTGTHSDKRDAKIEWSDTELEATSPSRAMSKKFDGSNIVLLNCTLNFQN